MRALLAVIVLTSCAAAQRPKPLLTRRDIIVDWNVERTLRANQLLLRYAIINRWQRPVAIVADQLDMKPRLRAMYGRGPAGGVIVLGVNTLISEGPPLPPPPPQVVIQPGQTLRGSAEVLVPGYLESRDQDQVSLHIRFSEATDAYADELLTWTDGPRTLP
jgi:hypothetical protein